MNRAFRLVRSTYSPGAPVILILLSPDTSTQRFYCVQKSLFYFPKSFPRDWFLGEPGMILRNFSLRSLICGFEPKLPFSLGVLYANLLLPFSARTCHETVVAFVEHGVIITGLTSSSCAVRIALVSEVETCGLL